MLFAIPTGQFQTFSLTMSQTEITPLRKPSVSVIEMGKRCRQER
jgi:hypothetical protein